MASISQFRGTYKDGFSRANRFAVYWDGVQVFAESVTLPSKTVTTFAYNLFGPIIHYPYRETFNDNIVLTFLEHPSGFPRKLSEYHAGQTIWNGKASPGNVETTANNLTIQQLSQSGTPTMTYKIYGAYPISIVPVNMGHAMNNEITKTQVMIKYYRYKVE
jgi:hypothetical protein